MRDSKFKFAILTLFLVVLLSFLILPRVVKTSRTVSYTEFYSRIEDKETEDIRISDDQIYFKDNSGYDYVVNRVEGDNVIDRLQEYSAEYKIEPRTQFPLSTFLTIVIVTGVGMFIYKKKDEIDEAYHHIETHSNPSVNNDHKLSIDKNSEYDTHYFSSTGLPIDTSVEEEEEEPEDAPQEHENKTTTEAILDPSIDNNPDEKVEKLSQTVPKSKKKPLPRKPVKKPEPEEDEDNREYDDVAFMDRPSILDYESPFQGMTDDLSDEEMEEIYEAEEAEERNNEEETEKEKNTTSQKSNFSASKEFASKRSVGSKRQTAKLPFNNEPEIDRAPLYITALRNKEGNNDEE